MHCSSADASFLVNISSCFPLIRNQQLHCDFKFSSCISFVRIQQLRSFPKFQQMHCSSADAFHSDNSAVALFVLASIYFSIARLQFSTHCITARIYIQHLASHISSTLARKVVQWWSKVKGIGGLDGLNKPRPSFGRTTRAALDAIFAWLVREPQPLAQTKVRSGGTDWTWGWSSRGAPAMGDRREDVTAGR
ncbi:hypothetical protein F511_34298 [Dorcoceras hygrometricum]|uniref:Uncharacterized protein n=1 Tax=Dorcoceras hygrometricum TaxID=472368 RepID=A0A2Z7BEB9_9LAMI|nr:hypothetical protein F511_34298 [Dorcoceras hygrometricum]